MSLLDDFRLLQGWDAHYSWLIKQGASHINNLDRATAHRIPNCASGVWYTLYCENGILHLKIDSEASLFKGVAKLLISILDNTHIIDVASKVGLINDLKLNDYLSYSRRAGVNTILSVVSDFAKLQMKGNN